jgi:hypothetical protein
MADEALQVRADFLHPEFKSFVLGYRSEAVPAAELRDAAGRHDSRDPR